MMKKRKNFSRFFYHGVRIILGVIFIYASYDKISHAKAFAEVVYYYQILPDNLINLTAIFLPWIEIMIGVFLIVGFWMPGTVIWSNILLVIYTGALGYDLVRGLDINCGCFSTTKGGSISIEHILWDAVFLSLSIYLSFFIFRSETIEGSK